MGQFQNLCGSLLFLALLIISSSHLIIATPLYYTMANLLTSWTNNPTPMNSSDDITFRTVLHAGAGSSNPQFFCGFYCNNSIDNPVKINATVNLTEDGDLVLREADGTLVWSTNTSGKNVSGLSLTEMGNLVLFDRNNATVWQSFDQPTDCLVPGQKLLSGQKLIASVSTYNLSRGFVGGELNETCTRVYY
ncbi:unnamed protein product [Ilex paraguariensis]|uniref:Bulb-type lectin domain-containing protein n=1 Tax=Ilex paraguariensis TaxID=185542 RepID=A0ABC8SEV8_9AQUA